MCVFLIVLYYMFVCMCLCVSVCQCSTCTYMYMCVFFVCALSVILKAEYMVLPLLILMYCKCI